MTRRVSFDGDKGIFTATRTIRESGNSVIVAIPPQLVEAASFEVGDDVELSAQIDSGEIHIRRVDTCDNG